MKIFYLFILLILLAGFVFHIFAIRNNHFYFTVDQGRDAVYVREIVNYHKIFKVGPETNIKGVFAGPMEDYLLSIGYFLFHGNPLGGVFVMIILNLLLTAILIINLESEVGKTKALLVGLSLQFFWWFFSTSLYAFHPFPLVTISFMGILCLIQFLKGKRVYFLMACGLIFLAFNVEVAGATSLLIFLITVYLLRSKRKVLIFSFLALLIVAIKMLTLVSSNVFIGTNFLQMFQEFIKIIGRTTIPQQIYLGAILFLILNVIFVYQKKKNNFVKNFIYLSLVLTLTSYLFFSSNHGWRDWHTVYLAPLLFINVLLILSQIPKKFSIPLFLLIMSLQILNFSHNYQEYLNIKDDNGILSNQLKIMDWIYSKSEGNGFNVYTYTNTFYDYNYQYLFGWYGKSKYGFYPCEYSNFPPSHKELYIPGWQHYVEPKLGCDKFRFLIVESDTNGESNSDWITEFRIEHHFVEKVTIGKTVVEKYKTRDIY